MALVSLPLALEVSASIGIRSSRPSGPPSLAFSRVILFSPSYLTDVLRLHYILLITFPRHSALFFPNNLSTSLPNVHLRSSCLFLFGFKTLLLATTLCFLVVRYFPLALSCPPSPLGPLSRFEACHCLALPHAVGTTSGRPADSISVEEALYFVLFVSCCPCLRSHSLLDGRQCVHFRPLPLLCFFSVGPGRGDEARLEDAQ